MKIIKKWVLISLTILVPIFIPYAMEAKASYNSAFLSLLLQIDGEQQFGEIRSIIIPTRDYFFFFNDGGKCVKKIKLLQDVGPNRYILSNNSKFCAVIEDVEKKDSFVLSLFNYRGIKIWTKEIQDPLMILGVSNDGSRVFIRLSTHEEADYSVLIMLDEKGNEKCNFPGMEIEKTEDGYAISSNGRYWICRNTSYASIPEKFLLFDYNGKRLFEKKMGEDVYIQSIGDNGNSLIEYRKNAGTTFILYDNKGGNLKHYSNNVFRLTKNGKAVFYSYYDIIFDEIDREYRIKNNRVNEFTDNKVRIFHDMGSNMSYNGDFSIIRLDTKELTLCFIFKDGNIMTKKFNLNGYSKLKNSYYKILGNDEFLGIWNSDSTKCNIFRLEG